ncbi:xanthine dehydrogenase family protein molybdopterin-binding subunit [Aquicoccus porphyridii]|uniref:Xanthine dehydrogenase family protein molybdopterin-binding subunit n=1 Tax=Aquicoccus porphyridii TaxID=1852029 RepID=A0A5A9ZCC4_9RHOB|nr:xanthine dehydrogenase family protein molybdopterin-binding subunit [Aquicoccus porphyridii]KAA0914877.1 xanthine dehydrogenase family protein molybdopterin-binding subunit [Aquicoccus porphyridii]RAI52577.1 xanthine dehydrogenase family protein molybdopterin-binding subunit [Rhodobacteraceae bacterium AsT-22]
MNVIDQTPARPATVNLSRRGFLGASLGSLVLAVALPGRSARAQETAEIVPGTRVGAFIEIGADGRVRLQSPFIEGGQGIFTALAQLVGEELDSDPADFIVENAPPGPDYQLGGFRITGGSHSVQASYEPMRRLGAAARQMLLAAGVARLDVPVGQLSTEPGKVIHAASGRSLSYGELAGEAAALPVPDDVTLRDEADFRWIRQPLKRLDIRDKSTGKATYTIDVQVEGMAHAAIQHAPRLGGEPGRIANEAVVAAMTGVQSIQRLQGAVAVIADYWWHARQAVEALQVTWTEPEPGTPNTMPADFSTTALRAAQIAAPGPGIDAENHGDTASALAAAAQVVEATYDAPLLVHGQLEPPSTLARWNADGTLDLWLPNQAPDVFRNVAAQVLGLAPEQIHIHSPLLGGFFGRHFLYNAGHPFLQAAFLARAAGRPVKLIWSREEEFLRDSMRPQFVARMRAGLDDKGLPVALEIETVGDGPSVGQPEGVAKTSVVEGLREKPYAIANRRIAQVVHPYPVTLGFWRSVGHSMNGFFYEGFLDEIADAGGQDPFTLRQHLLSDSPRHLTLLDTVSELSGGWKRGPYTAEDGSRRARGVAMASAFGSELATLAEVSIEYGEAKVHDIWVAVDPGKIVNPAIIRAQVESSVATGLSSALVEEQTYENGMPQARNFDGYPFLARYQMPRVHVGIVESGAPIGGIGEPGVPGTPPAVVNAVAALTGQRIRSLPLSKTELEETL